MRRLSKPYSTSIDGSFQIVKERKSKRSKKTRAVDPNASPPSFTLSHSLLSVSLSGDGGADRDRTGDPLLAKQVLSQLSYSPVHDDADGVDGVPRRKSAEAQFAT